MNSTRRPGAARSFSMDPFDVTHLLLRVLRRMREVLRVKAFATARLLAVMDVRCWDSVILRIRGRAILNGVVRTDYRCSVKNG